jgi:hypothetical protein
MRPDIGALSVGPIMGAPGERPHALALSLDDEAETVVFEFVKPIRTGWNFGAASRDALQVLKSTHGGEIDRTRRNASPDTSVNRPLHIRRLQCAYALRFRAELMGPLLVRRVCRTCYWTKKRPAEEPACLTYSLISVPRDSRTAPAIVQPNSRHVHILTTAPELLVRPMCCPKLRNHLLAAN